PTWPAHLHGRDGGSTELAEVLRAVPPRMLKALRVQRLPPAEAPAYLRSVRRDQSNLATYCTTLRVKYLRGAGNSRENWKRMADARGCKTARRASSLIHRRC